MNDEPVPEPVPASAAPADDIEGWFDPLDQALFAWFLEWQRSQGLRGHLLELGAYLGRSAVLLGRHLGPSEELFVCDLFGGPAPTEANRRENARFYPGLTRDDFLRNYLRHHTRPPRVVQGDTSRVRGLGLAGQCRFVHVDASHQYRAVRADIGLAREVLPAAHGIAALDDYRAPHTPGVALATWEAVLNRGLNPVCCSRTKLYGTWGDPEPAQAALRHAAPGGHGAELYEEELDGRTVLLLKPGAGQALFAPSGVSPP